MDMMNMNTSIKQTVPQDKKMLNAQNYKIVKCKYWEKGELT